MAPGLFTLMRTHWKKSSALLLGSSFGIWYSYDYTITNDVMKISSKKAAVIGDAKLKTPLGATRHITVILNPVAGKRKSKKLYTRWVEPLLHLAGIKVSLVETESPNQAYELMKIISDCDGVAIVGGDGTVHEAINGLLHRLDCDRAAKSFPIAIIPTGQYNSIARYIHQNLHYRNQSEFLIQSTMRLINSCTTKHDVIKITPVDQSATSGESMFALRDIRYGRYQDNFFKVSGIEFYQKMIKPFWLRIQRLVRPSKYPYPKIDSISYTEPCEGCSKCIDRHRLKGSQPTEVEQTSSNKRWWSVLIPFPKTNSAPSEEELRERELAKRENPDCGTWIKVGQLGDISDFRACMMGDKKVRLSLSRRGELNPSDITETQDVRLKVAAELDEEIKVATESRLNTSETQSEEHTSEEAEKSKEPEQDTTTKFLIDGQPIQAHSVEITALSKAITVFTGSFDMSPLEGAPR